MKIRKYTLAVMCSAVLWSSGPAFAKTPEERVMDAAKSFKETSRDMSPITAIIKIDKIKLQAAMADLPEKSKKEVARILRQGWNKVSKKNLFRIPKKKDKEALEEEEAWIKENLSERTPEAAWKKYIEAINNKNRQEAEIASKVYNKLTFERLEK